MLDIKRRPIGIKYRELFETQEIERLLEACKQSKNKDLYYIMKLAFLTGKRKNEIMGIESNMIFVKEKLVVIPFEKTKTKKKDLVFHVLDPECWAHLLEKKRTKQGRIYEFKNPRKALHSALLRAKIDTEKKFQVARSTVATTLFEKGQADACSYIDHSNPANAAKFYIRPRLVKQKEQQKIIMSCFSF
jgi:integrase